MFTAETVTVRTYTSDGVDSFNVPVKTHTDTEIGGVLVGPGPRTDIDVATRPDGVKVVYNLHFPKSYSGLLRGCQVKVRGSWYKVVGDPQPYTPENTPGDWNMPVEVMAVDG